MVEELLSFQVKISVSGHDTYGAWREGTHDDLVLATALAVWVGEKKVLPRGMRYKLERRSTGRRLHPEGLMSDGLIRIDIKRAALLNVIKGF